MFDQIVHNSRVYNIKPQQFLNNGEHSFELLDLEARRKRLLQLLRFGGILKERSVCYKQRLMDG